ncbi:MAG TPA: hypothetical protein VEC56_09325 [Candidatus Krumholzibacteria bacterium]|nr:hypothetical protein [Candidatus Krumholzibacteria bacterium]
MRVRYRSLVAILVSLAATPVQAATWYVHPGGGGDTTTIQGGVDLAANGDSVLVAPGTYTGAGNVNVLVDSKSITIVSESTAYNTILDCQGSGQGFIFVNADGSVLHGFTVKNGLGAQGGGIRLDNTDMTVRYNIVSGNTATLAGGGIFVFKGNSTIHNNTIVDNWAPAGGGLALKGPITGQVYQNIICTSAGGGGIDCTTGPFNTVFTCNDIWGNVGGDAICAVDGGSNISVDPLFCGIPGSGNVYIQQTSQCTATFSPCGQAIGALGILCTTTKTQSVTWGTIKALYR